MFRKIAGAWLKYFLPGFHPWNEDDRALLAAYEATAKPGREPQAKGEAGGLGRQRLLFLGLAFDSEPQPH